MSKLLKFVDDSIVLTKIKNEEDIGKLQDDLLLIYKWGDKNHMRWNNMKYEVHRLGPDDDIRKDTLILNPDSVRLWSPRK